MSLNLNQVTDTLTPTTGTVNVNGAVALNGGTTIGDAAGDSLTINSSTASLPNNLNLNGNVGLGTAPIGVPATRLVIGDGGGDEGATVYPGTGGTASLHFSDVPSEKAFLKWAAADGALRFGTAGVERVSITSTGKVDIKSGALPNGGGFKHARVTTGSITAGSTALVTVTWDTAFADGAYTVSAQVEDSTTSSSSLSVVHVEAVTSTAVAVRVLNNAASALTGTLHVIAIHD